MTITFEVAREQWTNETFTLAIEQGLVPAHVTAEYRETMYANDLPWYELTDDGTIFVGLVQITSKSAFTSWETWCEQQGLPEGWW